MPRRVRRFREDDFMQGPPSVRRPIGSSAAAAAAAAAAVAATRSTSPFTRPGRISGPTRIPSMTRLQSRAVAPFAGQRELKYLDTQLTGMPFGTSGAGRVVCLNALAEGADNTGRVGRQVFIKSVELRGLINSDPQVTAATLCRMLIIWDNANNSSPTVPVGSDILQTDTSTSMPNVNNAFRFTILWDQQFALGPDVAATPGTSHVIWNPTVPVHKYLPVGASTIYSATTAGIGTITSGSLLFFTIGDSAPSYPFQFNGFARIRFTDG